jgi:hypothetical protein
MITQLHSLLLANTETEVLEFKEAATQFDKNKLGKYFSALSNEANLKGLSSAWLLFGVANDKSIVGTSISDAQINDYKLEIATHTSPKFNFTEVHRVVENGHTVLMCEIPPAPQGTPVSWKGHYYGRDGESLGALNDNERERIRLQLKQQDWSAQIVPNAIFDDLSLEAIIIARSSYLKKNPHLKAEIATWDDVTLLNKAKVTITGKVLDKNYANKLAQMPNLSLTDIMLLDKVAKKLPLSAEEIKTLKEQNLIEGRKPNFYISSEVAIRSNQKTEYFKLKGINDDYIQKIIQDYLTKFGSAKKKELENVLIDKMGDTLDISQKKNKIKNELQKLKNKGVISILGKNWRMSN